MGQCVSVEEVGCMGVVGGVAHPLSLLPSELQLHVLSFLPPPALGQAELTCKHWRRMILKGHQHNRLMKTQLDCLCVLSSKKRNKSSASDSDMVTFHPHKEKSSLKDERKAGFESHPKDSPMFLSRFAVKNLVFWHLSSSEQKSILVDGFIPFRSQLSIKPSAIHFYDCNFESVSSNNFRQFLSGFANSQLESLILDNCLHLGQIVTDDSLSDTVSRSSLKHLTLNGSQNLFLDGENSSEELVGLSTQFFLNILDISFLGQLKIANCLSMTSESVAGLANQWMSLPKSHRKDMDVDCFGCAVNLYQVAALCEQYPMEVKEKTLVLEIEEKRWTCFSR